MKRARVFTTRAPYKSRLYRAGPLCNAKRARRGVDAGAPRNHIRHEQAASPREFTSANLRFRRSGSRRTTRAARCVSRSVARTITPGDQEIIVGTRLLIIISPYRCSR